MSQIPVELIAGDTWAWTRDLGDYPAGTWSGAWYFENADANFSVSAAASGTTHTGTVAAATSAGYRAGRYRWRFVVTNGSTRQTVESGWLDVAPDPAASGNVDHRSAARVVLDNIDAYLRDRTNLQAASFTVAGRSLSRYSMSEVLSLKSQMEAEIKREEAASRLASGVGSRRNKVFVRFGRG